jgi:cyanate lyase
MTRTEATEQVLSAKQKKGVTYAELARTVGRHPVWVTAALLGQATMSADEANKAVKALDLGADVAAALQEVPTRGDIGEAVPVDPVLYRFYEIVQVYGTSLKALIHEQFGDGIMSAIDLEIDLKKEENPKGDRVVLTLNGKFLPYKKW